MRPWPISPNRSKRPCHSGSANATDWVTRRHLPRKPHSCVCLGGSSGDSVQFPVLGPLRIWYRISMGLQWPHTASALSSASGWFSDGSGWLAADKALCPLHLRARRVCLASGSSCNVVCPVVPRVLFVPLYCCGMCLEMKFDFVSTCTTTSSHAHCRALPPTPTRGQSGIQGEVWAQTFVCPDAP